MSALHAFPPRIPLALIRILVSRERAREVAMDLEELFARHLREVGSRRARLRHWREAMSVVTWSLIDRMRRPFERRMEPAGISLSMSAASGDNAGRGIPSTREGGRSGGAHPGGTGGWTPVRGPKALWNGLRQDLHFALRASTKRLGFTVVAIAILGVGIGATTTIFSVVDTVLLRALPYPDPDRLVFFDEGAHSAPDFIEWRDRLESLERIGAVRNRQTDLTGEGEPERLQVAYATPDFLGVLGASPHLGRLLVEDDYREDARVVVLGQGLWRRRWGSDPSVVGTRIQLDGEPYLVVGVLSPSFRNPMGVMGGDNGFDLWMPLDIADPRMQHRGFRALSVVARLRPEVDREAAQAELDALMAGLAEVDPQFLTNRDGSVRDFPLIPLHQAVVGDVQNTLWILLGAVGLMLLIACANVANLLLARGTERRREIALRGALGASATRIAGQLLIESTALTLAGGILGVALAFLGVEVVSRYNPGGIPRIQNLAVDPRILLFAVAASMATGVMCGMLPALQAARGDVNEGLKEGAATASTGRDRKRFRSGLVVAEIALTLVLLAGAGLLFRSMLETFRVDPGFDTDELVNVPLAVPASDAAERMVFVRQLVERIETLQGTESVAVSHTVPFEFTGTVRCCWIGDVLAESAAEDADVRWSVAHPVTPGYFETLGISLTRGSVFDEVQVRAEPDVAILSSDAAVETFGHDDVVGERIRFREFDLTVVGVVDGVHHWGLRQDQGREIYLPYEHFGAENLTVHLTIRTSADLEALAPALREAVWGLNPDLPVPEILTMRQRISTSLAAPRFLSILFGFFAAVAVLLACAGIYASMLYSVGQRRDEMGIRLALGAEGGRLIRMILGQGMALTVLGLVLGLGGAFGLTRFLESMVWGVTTTDATTFASVTILLALVALAGCVIPAVRASRSDPLSTLRAE